MKISIIFLFILLSFPLFAQKDCIDYPDNYIPIDLMDAINYLDCIWNEAEKQDFKIIPEDAAVNDYYRGYGTRIRSSWRLLTGDSDIYKYLQGLGISNPEDMSHLILTSFHRHLNKKDLEIEKRIERYIIIRKRREAQERKLRETHFADFVVNDTVYFKYKLGFSSKEQINYFYNDSCDAIGIVIEKNPSNLQLKVRLIESCDTLGLVIAIEDVYEKKDLKVILIEEKKFFYIKEGEEKWTFYELWQKND